MSSLINRLFAALAMAGFCTSAMAADSSPATAMPPSGDAQPLPKLAVLEPELEGDLEDPSRVPGWNRKMAALDAFLRQELATRNLYTVLSNEPASDLIERDKARREVHDCLPCIQDVGQRLGADRVLVVWVNRMSELVMFLSARVVDPTTGDLIVARSMTFRGDNDRAWNKAADFFLRQLAELPLGRR
jgi:hypothetical protein